MVLGAAVRALDAGLTCPDWPLCFGRAVPEFHIGVYLEFIHRCVAGFVALIFMACYAFVFTNKKYHSLRWVMTVGFFLLMAQIIMGGLTVLKLLQPGIVTLHLGLATAFLISLIFVEQEIKPVVEDVGTTDRRRFQKYRLVALVGFIAICVQILLGGWVATNYAGAVCVDFPTCNGQFFPTWTGPIGAQVIHRLGAYTLSIFYVSFFIYSLKLARAGVISAKDKIVAGQMFMLILSQVMVGVLNLKLLVPPWLTVIHLGLAIFLMLTILRLCLRLQARAV